MARPKGRQPTRRSSLGRTLARRRGARTNGAARGNGEPAAALSVIGLASDHPCAGCAQCCTYVAIEIDAPTTMTEYDYLVWYLVHPDVSVFVDWEGSWFVKFETRCRHLLPNGMCGTYDTRPVICREFDWKECERHVTDEPPDKWLFRNAEELLAWFEKQRPKTYRKFLAFQRANRRRKTPKELRRLETAQVSRAAAHRTDGYSSVPRSTTLATLK